MSVDAKEAKKIATDELLHELAHAGMTEHRSAERMLDATLAVLGERLDEDERKAIAPSLSRRLRRVFESGGAGGNFDGEALYYRVCKRTRTRLRRGREETQIVLGAIGRALPEDARDRLGRALPAEIAELLHERAVSGPPPHAPSGVTLSSGRPGSRHPVSEAAPPTKAQSHSVACEDNPHGTRKLSSGRTR